MLPTALRTFGSRLRSLRLAKDLSQTELARLIGRHQTAIGPYERDEYTPARDVVEKLASILDTSPEYLIFGRSAHRTQVPVVGMVRPGTLVEERPPSRTGALLSLKHEHLIGFSIEDSAMAPAFPLGHILLALAVVDEGLDAYLGRPVLAQLQDGRVMLRFLLPARERERYDLAALASPTLHDMALIGVRPALGVLHPSAFEGASAEN